jgi:hypothetical protein
MFFSLKINSSHEKTPESCCWMFIFEKICRAESIFDWKKRIFEEFVGNIGKSGGLECELEGFLEVGTLFSLPGGFTELYY